MNTEDQNDRKEEQAEAKLPTPKKMDGNGSEEKEFTLNYNRISHVSKDQGSPFFLL